MTAIPGAGQGVESFAPAPPAPRPVGLTINTYHPVETLGPYGLALTALYGRMPFLVSETLVDSLVYPEVAMRLPKPLKRANSGMTDEQLQQHIRKPGWLAQQVQARVREYLAQQLAATYGDDHLQAVQCVFIDGSLLHPASILREALEPLLPGATFLSVDRGTGYLMQIWTEPAASHDPDDQLDAEKQQAGHEYI